MPLLLLSPILLLQVNAEEEQEEWEPAEDQLEISVRSSNVFGRTCFSSQGYSGTCRKSRYCKGASYSYSR
jgi:hypothetical protein